MVDSASCFTPLLVDDVLESRKDSDGASEDDEMHKTYQVQPGHEPSSEASEGEFSFKMIFVIC